MKKRATKKQAAQPRRYNLVTSALLASIGELLYIGLVILFFWFGDNFLRFDTMGLLGVGMFILVFVFSALASGFILLMYPAILFLNGQVKRAVTLIGWEMLFLFTAIIVIVAITMFLF